MESKAVGSICNNFVRVFNTREHNTVSIITVIVVMMMMMMITENTIETHARIFSDNCKLKIVAKHFEFHRRERIHSLVENAH